MNDKVRPAEDAEIQRLLTSPLDWLANELERLRASATAMDDLAAAPVYVDDQMVAAVHYLRSDLPRQFLDEDTDILPMLTLRARRDDDLDGIIGRLSDGHYAMAVMARQLLPRLEALKLVEQPVGADPWLAESLAALAARHRAHLAMVSAVILPIARLRLRSRDLKALGHDLAARRIGNRG